MINDCRKVLLLVIAKFDLLPSGLLKLKNFRFKSNWFNFDFDTNFVEDESPLQNDWKSYRLLAFMFFSAVRGCSCFYNGTTLYQRLVLYRKPSNTKTCLSDGLSSYDLIFLPFSMCTLEEIVRIVLTWTWLMVLMLLYLILLIYYT